MKEKKTCPTSLAIIEIQIKTTLRFLSYPNQNGNHSENKQVLARRWTKWNPSVLLAGTPNASATMEVNMMSVKILELDLS